VGGMAPLPPPQLDPPLHASVIYSVFGGLINVIKLPASLKMFSWYLNFSPGMTSTEKIAISLSTLLFQIRVVFSSSYWPVPLNMHAEIFFSTS